MRSLFQGSLLAALALFAAGAKAQTVVPVIEYYDAHDDLYFITASAAEAAVVDSGADNVGASTWSRTGLTFNAYTSPGPGNDVCRFYNPNIPPVGIHFYTALPAECANVRATLPAWNYESGNVFNIPLPVNGTCASGLSPVTRYFDQRVNESWRFVITNSTIDATMLSRGWSNEGVQMCSVGTSTGGGTTQNTTTLSVVPDLGFANIPYVSVTVCVPNTSNCTTINDVVLDGGSIGLRILATSLPTSFSLPVSSDPNGNSLAECLPFVGAYAWGSLRTADIKIAGEQASSMAVQVIGDPQFSGVPSACSAGGVGLTTVSAFGGNAILGVGPFLQDCGTACANDSTTDVYFTCPAANPSSGCQATTVALAKQVSNPVGSFVSGDNNGVLISLPAIPAAGAATVTGSLIFGIGTQSDNALGSAAVLTTDSNGAITTTYKGVVSTSFIDPAQQVNLIPDSTITQCTDLTGLFCPASTLNLSAVNTGQNGKTSTVTFSIANADSLVNANPTFDAFSELAGASPSTTELLWGLPFFFGRNIFIAIEGMNTPGGAGPYYAY